MNKTQVEANWAQTHEGIYEQVWAWGRKYDEKFGPNHGGQPHRRRVVIDKPSHIVEVSWTWGVGDLRAQEAFASDEFKALSMLVRLLKDVVEP